MAGSVLSCLCSGIEVVITALTRNQVYQQWYRGFESHPLRHVEKALKMSKPRKRGFFIGQGLFSFPHATRFAGLARGPRFTLHLLK